MRLLLVGPFQDFSGYSHFIRNLFLTFGQDNTIDLVARSLFYDRSDLGKFKPFPELDCALKKPLKDIDIMIQSTTLNVEAEPKPGICNGIYFFWETDRIPPAWAQNANRFDFIMVPTRFVAQALLNSGVSKPIIIVPPPLDTSIYQKNIEPFEIPNAGDRTIFYNICQLSVKKGIDALIRAYYAAFADIPDDVLLVLKTYINMTNRQKDLDNIKGFIQQIRSGCRIPIQKHPPILPIVRTFSDDEIAGLHKTGHCYVNSSRGEGMCLPAMDSLGYGSILVSSKTSGMADWVSSDIALTYNALVTNVYDMHHSDPVLYTGVERYYEPSTAEMADIMRTYHLLRKKAASNSLTEDESKAWNEILQRQAAGKEFVNKFDYKKVWSKICPQIHAAFNSWKQNGRVEFANANEFNM